MKPPARRRPGFWWFFFFGRRRRGVPWLLIAVLGGSLLLAVSYRIPTGVEVSYWAGFVFIAIITALTLVSIGAVAYAALRRGRR